jgi:hypothetical protein
VELSSPVGIDVDRLLQRELCSRKKELSMPSYKHFPTQTTERYRLSTDAFAAQHLVEPQTVRKQYSVTGSYHGVRPVRLPNRRLLWPADSIQQIVADVLGQSEVA